MVNLLGIRESMESSTHPMTSTFPSSAHVHSTQLADSHHTSTPSPQHLRHRRSVSSHSQSSSPPGSSISGANKQTFPPGDDSPFVITFDNSQTSNSQTNLAPANQPTVLQASGISQPPIVPSPNEIAPPSRQLPHQPMAAQGSLVLEQRTDCGVPDKDEEYGDTVVWPLVWPRMTYIWEQTSSLFRPYMWYHIFSL